MADEWQLPELKEWWLPDDGLCSPVVRSVKAFMEEDRLPGGEESRSEDQRNIHGIFSKLSVQEDPRWEASSDQAHSLAAPRR